MTLALVDSWLKKPCVPASPINVVRATDDGLENVLWSLRASVNPVENSGKSPWQRLLSQPGRSAIGLPI